MERIRTGRREGGNQISISPSLSLSLSPSLWLSGKLPWRQENVALTSGYSKHGYKMPQGTDRKEGVVFHCYQAALGNQPHLIIGIYDIVVYRLQTSGLRSIMLYYTLSLLLSILSFSFFLSFVHSSCLSFCLPLFLWQELSLECCCWCSIGSEDLCILWALCSE